MEYATAEQRRKRNFATWASHLQGFRWRQQSRVLAQVLCLLVANYARHEAAPVQRDRNSNGHLIQPHVPLRVAFQPFSAAAGLIHMPWHRGWDVDPLRAFDPKTSVQMVCRPNWSISQCVQSSGEVNLLGHDPQVTAQGEAAAAGGAGALDGGHGHQGRPVQARQEHIGDHPKVCVPELQHYFQPVTMEMV